VPKIDNRTAVIRHVFVTKMTGLTLSYYCRSKLLSLLLLL